MVLRSYFVGRTRSPICSIALIILITLVMERGAHGACDSSDPDEPTNDCDGDGVTIEQGDCEDADATISPDVEELCEDQIDNNCDGFFDEGCENIWASAELSGGGQCQIGPLSPSVVWIGLALLTVRRRGS